MCNAVALGCDGVDVVSPFGIWRQVVAVVLECQFALSVDSLCREVGGGGNCSATDKARKAELE